MSSPEEEEPTRRQRALALAREVKQDSKLNLIINKDETGILWSVRKRKRRPRMALKLARKIGKDEYGLIIRVGDVQFRLGVERQPGSNNYVKLVVDADRDDVIVIREEILEEEVA